MDVYKSDDEQVETIKKWWVENGKSIVFGVIVGLAAIFGWRGWQDHLNLQAAAASELYQQLLVAVRANKPQEAREAADQIVAGYEKTIYAAFAKLLLARFAADNNELDRAAELLRSVLDESGNTPLQLEIRLRLARVLTARKEYDQALALLDIENRGAFDGSYAELKGDILMAKGDTAGAQTAYQQAMLKTRVNNATPDMATLEMKADDLGPLSN